MYLSFVPGRIRVRFADREKMEQVAALARSLPGVREVTATSRTGSLLIRCDAGLLDRATLLALMQQHLPEMAAAVATSSASASPTNPMTLVKRGMLASLALTLVLALLDREKAHVLAGSSFPALLSYHLYNYRNRLLK